MKRLYNIFVAISIITIFIVTLIIVVLRLFLPKINEYRSQLEWQFQSLYRIPFKINNIKGEWESFGPVLTLSDISIATEKITIKANKVKFSLDIWRSIFSLHLRFRDIIFYKLNINYYKPLGFITKDDFSYFNLSSLNKVLLKKFDYFTLKESSITFLTSSTEKRTLKISELTWLNKNKYHIAQGFINFDALQQKKNQNSIQIKVNLHNKNDAINEGMVYLHADNINFLPLLSYWLGNSTGLEKAVFNLSSWVVIKNNRIVIGKLQLHQVEANWKINNESHQLSVNDLLITLYSKKNGWLFDIPQLQHLKTDRKKWLAGKISLLYLPQSKTSENNWRIRVNNIQLERLKFILPIISSFTPEFINDWQKRKLKGKLIALALDIIPCKPEKTLIDLIWQDISWIRWKDLPSVSHFSGLLRGTKKVGMFSFNLNKSFVEYSPMFKEQLEIYTGNGTIFWSEEDNERQIWSKNLEIQVKSLWTRGNFSYLAPKNIPPTLSILVGAKLTDISDAWRYFPTTLMNKDLTNYLTKSIIAGHTDEATIIFHGDPADFPFKKNNGQFQVFIPLRGAAFKYQPDWPTIFDLDIDVNFERNGLHLSAPSIKLDDARALDFSADIEDCNQPKLLIKSNIAGNGKAIANYFNKSPMKNSIGKALNTIKIGGNITGKLMLDIPLEETEGNIIATGQIDLNNNDVDITIINGHIKKLTGRFYFYNSNLKSEKLQAQLFDQPINLRFNTINNQHNYQININIDGSWQSKKIATFPKLITDQFINYIDWKGQINIELPNKIKQNPNLSIIINGKLGNINSKSLTLDTQKINKLHDIQISANGDKRKLQIYGNIDQLISFNSQLQLFDKEVRLLKVNIQPYTKKNIILPSNSIVMINLPEINDLKWLSLLSLFSSLRLKSSDYNKSFFIPDIAIINLQKIKFAKQQWNNIAFTINRNAKLTTIVVDSNKLKGSLIIPKYGSWKANINYLYFNPEISTKQKNYQEIDGIVKIYDISGWPNINIYCSECWIAGYKIGEIKAQIIRNKQMLILKEGSLINSATNLKISGMWHSNQQNVTTIRGELKGNQFDDLFAYYGILVPIKHTSFNIDFNLNWMAPPWKPNINMLNGNLNFNLTNGGISQIGSSSNQLLHFVSFNALLRKLQLDFSDTFSNDFLFDSIRGIANIKNGILNTNNFYIDGLISDIIINGKINLVHRNMNLEAIIIPEISTTVGVATALAVNPLAGAAAFAATKVLGKLWNKISLIRYRITGNPEKLKIYETLRKLKENKEYDK
ncbi:MAG: YhdP family protein [Arsenophonus sp.]